MEAGSKYGDNILNDYSIRLAVEFGKSIMREHWDVLDNIIEYLKMKTVATGDQIVLEPLFWIIIY